MSEKNKIYWASAVSCSCGTFLGNFIYHAMQANYDKGVAIGSMASLFS